jgi:hypothetical protein
LRCLHIEAAVLDQVEGAIECGDHGDDQQRVERAHVGLQEFVEHHGHHDVE